MPKLMPLECTLNEFTEEEDETMGVQRRIRLQPIQSKQKSIIEFKTHAFRLYVRRQFNRKFIS